MDTRTTPTGASSTESRVLDARDRGVVVACIAAGFALTGIEVARWIGLRNYLPVGYYGLCIALALGASLLVGLMARTFRLSRGVALSAWVAVTGAVVVDPLFGLIAAAATGFSLHAGRSLDRPPAALEGASVGAALCPVLLKGHLASDLVPWISESLAEALAGGVILAVLLYVVPRLAASFHGPMRAATWATVPVLIAAWFALEPWTHRASGLHRRPPARFADLRPVPEDAEQLPDVLLIVLDTLRADRMSVYGYERETTPQLARLMRERPNSVAFPAAYSNGTWTVPSHGSLFTGMLPNQHGAHFDLDGSLRTQFGLHDGTPRLAALLQQQGYATLGTYANYWLRIVGGMRDGFDAFFRVIHFDRLPFLGESLRDLLIPGAYLDVTKGGSRGSMVNRSLLDLTNWWDAGIDNPLFLFANYGDTHGPYVPPEPFRGTFHSKSLRDRARHLSVNLSEDEREVLSARYDEELLYLDSQLGILLDQLAATGFLDNAWVFITSDHGEAFAEHGITEHGTTVHQEVVRIPLLVFPPKGVSIPQDDAPVSLIDITATIAAIAGTMIEGSPGRDLRVPESGNAIAHIEFYGDAAKASVHGKVAALPQRSVLRGSWKLVERGPEGQTELMLFDLASDPGEEHDVSAENADVVEELTSLLSPYGEPARSNVRIDDATQQRLDDMGYGSRPGAEDESQEAGPDGPGQPHVD